MKALRNPDTGCPWDIEQDFKSIAPHTIEEAYEVADAIDREDMDDLKDELGDLLLQVVYHAQMAEEAGLFTFDDIAAGINDKMIRRHPHVFGDKKAATAIDVNKIWDQQKDSEKKKQNNESALDSVTLGLPALLRSQKLQKKAAREGFQWTTLNDILSKLDEEIDEFKSAITYDEGQQAIEDELGDILFVLVNVARHYGVNAENALQKSNNKFTCRFKGMEDELKLKNKTVSNENIDNLLALWKKQKAKQA